MIDRHFSVWFPESSPHVHKCARCVYSGTKKRTRAVRESVRTKDWMGMTEMTSCHPWRTTLLHPGICPSLSDIWDDGILLEWYEQMTSTWLGDEVSSNPWDGTLKKTSTSKTKDWKYRRFYSWISSSQRFLLGWKRTQDPTTKERKNTGEVLLREKENSYSQEWRHCWQGQTYLGPLRNLWMKETWQSNPWRNGDRRSRKSETYARIWRYGFCEIQRNHDSKESNEAASTDKRR